MNISDTTTYIPNVMGYKLTLAKDILHENSLNITRISFDETVHTHQDTINAMVLSQLPAASDSIKYRLGTDVQLLMTIDPEKIIIETEKLKKEESPETEEE